MAIASSAASCRTNILHRRSGTGAGPVWRTAPRDAMGTGSGDDAWPPLDHGGGRPTGTRTASLPSSACRLASPDVTLCVPILTKNGNSAGVHTEISPGDWPICDPDPTPTRTGDRYRHRRTHPAPRARSRILLRGAQSAIAIHRQSQPARNVCRVSRPVSDVVRGADFQARGNPQDCHSREGRNPGLADSRPKCMSRCKSVARLDVMPDEHFSR